MNSHILNIYLKKYMVLFQIKSNHVRRMAGCHAQEFPSLFLTMLSFLLHSLVVFAAGKKHQLRNSISPHYCIPIKMEVTGQQFIHAQTRAESHQVAFRNPRINCYSLGALPWWAEVREFQLREGKS